MYDCRDKKITGYVYKIVQSNMKPAYETSIAIKETHIWV